MARAPYISFWLTFEHIWTLSFIYSSRQIPPPSSQLSKRHSRFSVSLSKLCIYHYENLYSSLKFRVDYPVKLLPVSVLFLVLVTVSVESFYQFLMH